MITFHKKTMKEFKEMEAKEKIRQFFASDWINVSVDEIASKITNEYISLERAKELIKEVTMNKE